jgi:hypothetical protein
MNAFLNRVLPAIEGRAKLVAAPQQHGTRIRMIGSKAAPAVCLVAGQRGEGRALLAGGPGGAFRRGFSLVGTND